METLALSSFKDLDDAMVVFERKYGMKKEALDQLRSHLGLQLSEHMANERLR